jgi:hypothetical protein
MHGGVEGHGEHEAVDGQSRREKRWAVREDDWAW